MGNSNTALFCGYKAKLSRKGKMVFYPGKPAVTMGNKESVGRRVERGKDRRRFRGPRGNLQIAPPEQKESQKHPRPSAAERKSQ